MSLQQLKNATRKQLIAYLEGWGYQCYPHETTAQLREAAILNLKNGACLKCSTCSRKSRH